VIVLSFEKIKKISIDDDKKFSRESFVEGFITSKNNLHRKNLQFKANLRKAQRAKSKKIYITCLSENMKLRFKNMFLFYRKSLEDL